MRPGIQTNKCYRQHQTFKTKIRERDNYTCQLCGQPGYFLDHIIPWAVSHDSSPGNMRVLCRPCNLKLRRERKDAALPVDVWEGYIESELSKYQVKEPVLTYSY